MRVCLHPSVVGVLVGVVGRKGEGGGGINTGNAHTHTHMSVPTIQQRGGGRVSAPAQVQAGQAAQVGAISSMHPTSPLLPSSSLSPDHAQTHTPQHRTGGAVKEAAGPKAAGPINAYQSNRSTVPVQAAGGASLSFTSLALKRGFVFILRLC